MLSSRIPISVALLLLSLSLLGCSSGYHGHANVTCSLAAQQITLSRVHPRDIALNIVLVSIAKDGTTALRFLDSGRIVRATPGDYFVSDEFGRHGLQLTRASAQTG